MALSSMRFWVSINVKEGMLGVKALGFSVICLAWVAVIGMRGLLSLSDSKNRMSTRIHGGFLGGNTNVSERTSVKPLKFPQENEKNLF